MIELAIPFDPGKMNLRKWQSIKGKCRQTKIFIDVLFINNLKIQGRAMGWLVAGWRLRWPNKAGRWTVSLVAQHRKKPMSTEHCGMRLGCLEGQRQVWKPRSPCKRSEQVRGRIATHTGEDWRGVRRGRPTLTPEAIHPLSLGYLNYILNAPNNPQTRYYFL